MENNRGGEGRAKDRNAQILTEEDINRQEYYMNLSSQQKSELIAFVYELSLVLYNSYFECE